MNVFPPVAVIVLNWNGLDDTRACAASLARMDYPAATVYLVDNASSDGSAAALASEFSGPPFVPIANAENLGFAGGNNAAVRRAREAGAAYVLLLNNDTVVAPDFLSRLMEAAQANPRAGLIAPKILLHDEPNTLWYAGGALDWNMWPPFSQPGENEPDDTPAAAAPPRPTGWVSGCCVLARAEMIEQIGDLDTRYGYYCEDVDWSLRAQQGGWTLLYVPQSRVWHKIGRSTKKSGRHAGSFYEYRNPILAARRHKGRGGFFAALPVALRAGWRALLHPGGPNAPDKTILLDAVRDGLRGRTGLMPASAGNSRLAQILARLAAPATRVFWAVNARRRQRSDTTTSVLT